jgi:hypothetical protein
MDERYSAFIAELKEKEMKKPERERSSGVVEDHKLMRWWNRRRMGLPTESDEEQSWRENFDAS